MSPVNIEFNLNQNLWLLLVSLISLGVSEYFYLKYLLIFSTIVTIFAVISLFFTVIFYTHHYCVNKLKK